MIHDYFGVDYEIVWDAASHKTHVLGEQVRSILQNESVDSELPEGKALTERQ